MHRGWISLNSGPMRPQNRSAYARTLSWLVTVSACSADLLGPLPGPEDHLSATVDGAPFVGFVPAPGCIGGQLTPSMFFVSVNAGGTLQSGNLSFHLGDISGPGRYTMRPDEVQEHQRAAIYIPDDPARLQYSALAGSGEIVIDEYDAVQRTVAGRFFFNAIRAVGTEGPEWIHIRQGSFRGRLRAWGSPDCS